MKTLEISRSAIAMSLAAGLLAGCGAGGYGGGGGSNPPASLNITVAPTAITLGQSATLTWTSTGNSCTASGDWAGSKIGDGSEVVTPAAAGMFTYSLRCRGGGYGESMVGSTTLSVSAAAASAVWRGESCCVDARAVEVTGLTDDAGAYRFLALGMHVIGAASAAGAAPAVYEACGDCLAGARLADANAVERLVLTPGIAARGALLLKGAAAGPQRLAFTAPYDRSLERTSDLTALRGIYTMSRSSGYAVTITIDANGEVNGADTRSCLVRGRVAAPKFARDAYRVALDVSGCGAANGRYLGSAAPLAGSVVQSAGLFLSASNTESAIGLRLDR